MREYPETHQQGIISFENREMFKDKTYVNGDIGVRIAEDGRIWVCIDGISFLRFKPQKSTTNMWFIVGVLFCGDKRAGFIKAPNKELAIKKFRDDIKKMYNQEVKDILQVTFNKKVPSDF